MTIVAFIVFLVTACLLVAGAADEVISRKDNMALRRANIIRPNYPMIIALCVACAASAFYLWA